MGVHVTPPVGKGAWIDQTQAKAYAERLVKAFDIRTRSTAMRAGALSGGNMQKAIIARELERNPELVIAAHPTRGVDVGSAEFVYAQLMHARARAAVLLVSSDLDEILRLSDRIVVMFQGAIMAELTPDTADPESIGLLMAGIAARADTGKEGTMH